MKEDNKKENVKLSPPEEPLLLEESYIRLMADFENYRKRMVKENEIVLQYACEKLIVDLLVIFDDLDHYEKSLKSEEEKKGIEMLRNKFLNILKAHGVNTLNPLGETFSPETAEAVQVIKTNKKGEDNKIVDIVCKGYKLKDKYLRYPKVVVCKYGEK